MSFAATFCLFLSTPSARRATTSDRCQSDVRGISIHALREEGDKRAFEPVLKMIEFLSTPSARRATFLRIDTFP